MKEKEKRRLAMKKDDEVSSEVGYRKPPKDTRFKNGESGNPKGRPKGRLNIMTVIARASGAKVVLNEGGRRREATKLEAGAIQLANKAAGGDLKALNLLVNLLRMAETEIREGSEGEASADARRRVYPEAYVLCVRRALGFNVSDEEIEQAAYPKRKQRNRPRRLTAGNVTAQSVADEPTDVE
jgi:hypothetical protein